MKFGCVKFLGEFYEGSVEDIYALHSEVGINGRSVWTGLALPMDRVNTYALRK